MALLNWSEVRRFAADRSRKSPRFSDSGKEEIEREVESLISRVLNAGNGHTITDDVVISAGVGIPATGKVSKR